MNVHPDNRADLSSSFIWSLDTVMARWRPCGDSVGELSMPRRAMWEPPLLGGTSAQREHEREHTD